MNESDSQDTDNFNEERESSSCNEKDGAAINENCSSDEGGPTMGVEEGEFKRISDLTVDEVCALQFDNEEDAYQFYNKYAKCHGFVVRKHNVGRNSNKNVITRHYVCNRQGLRNPKHLARTDRKRDHKPLTRTNCRARFSVRYNLKTSNWIVTCFEEAHNHELTPLKFVHLLPAYRGMTNADKAQIDSLHSHGIRTCHIMGYMVGQKGGYNNVGFTKKDLYNYFDSKVRGEIKDGDVVAALSYLQGKANHDPMLYAKFSTSSDGRLKRLFWADGDSRFDFSCFGDVLAFDTTYKKNKYNYPLVIFSGCNHHLQTIIFGCALVSDETTETYTWVLESFLEAMGNKHPKAVVTDGDGAMREAVKLIFPNAFHRLCAWHLHKNACENVKISPFLTDFKTAMYSNFTRERFEEFWKNMVLRHDLVGNSWVSKTYNNRSLWATAYLRDQFFGRLRTTSQCESINAIIKTYIRKKCSFFEFMHNFEQALRQYRNNEFVADFRSSYAAPVLTTSLRKIEEDAAKIFTEEIFQEVKEQIIKGCSLIVKERVVNGEQVIFRLTKYCDPDYETEVLYQSEKVEFSCACKRFESRGVPCSHIICAMKEEHMDHIPRHLVLTRWSKKAKASLMSYDSFESLDSDAMEAARFAAYSGACMRFCKVAAKRSELYNEVMDDIMQLTKKYELLEMKNSEDPIGASGSSLKHIGDPNIVKTKGAPKKKKLNIKRLRHCSKCGSTKHNARTCRKEKDKHASESSPSNCSESSSRSDRGLICKPSASHDLKKKTSKGDSNSHNDGMIGCSSAGGQNAMSQMQTMSPPMAISRDGGHVSSSQGFSRFYNYDDVPFYPHNFQSAVHSQAPQFYFGVPQVNIGTSVVTSQGPLQVPNFYRAPTYPNNAPPQVPQVPLQVPNFYRAPTYPNNAPPQVPQLHSEAQPLNNNNSSCVELLEQVMKTSSHRGLQ